MSKFEFCDKVRHLTNNEYNSLLMEVKETKGNKILCSYLDVNKKIKEEWFDEIDLVLVNKAEGGFLA